MKEWKRQVNKLSSNIGTDRTMQVVEIFWKQNQGFFSSKTNVMPESNLNFSFKSWLHARDINFAGGAWMRFITLRYAVDLYCLGGCKSYLHILIKEQWVIASFREQQIIISLIEETKTHKLTTRGFAVILICTVTSDTNL